MADEPEAGKKGTSGGGLARLTATGKAAGAIVAFLLGLLALWTAIKPDPPPSASVTFKVCRQDLVAVHITNDGSSSAEISPMKFQLIADGETTSRTMEAVIYVDEDSQRSDPADPNESNSLAGGKARDYQFPTDGVYFRPEYRSCIMTVNLSIGWGKLQKPYSGTCPCQR